MSTGLPPVKRTAPPMSTGLPPVKRTAPPMSTGLPPNRAQTPLMSPTSLSGLPTTSPIEVIDWEERLKAGDENAATRQVKDNELVRHQLNELTASDSRYIQQARDHAMSAASGRGMMLSSMAAGNAQRAAIDAALPIAQQDASTYLTTSRDNMAAINADRLADQGMFGQLLGQEMGISANLAEAERGRGFTARENAANRSFQSSQSAAQRAFQASENRLGRGWQADQNALGRGHEANQNALNRAHDEAMQTTRQAWESQMAENDRDWRGMQHANDLQQQRFLEYNASMRQHNINLSNTLAGIYSNPNLTAQQQAQAARNARAVHASLAESYAASMRDGVPQIFWEPYEAPPPPPTPPPNTSPPGGTRRPPIGTPITDPGYGGPGGGYYKNGGRFDPSDVSRMRV